MSFLESGRKRDSSLAAPSNSRRLTNRRRSRLTWRRVLLGGMLILLVLGGGYAIRLGWSLYNFNNNTYHPLPDTPTADPNGEEMWPEEALTPEPTAGLGTPTHVPRPTRVPVT